MRISRKSDAAKRTLAPIELTEAEWEIMKVVWEKQPCTAGTVQEELAATRDRAYSTVKTTMDRMVEKGFLQIERIRNQAKAGTLRLPENRSFIVEIELVDGTVFPHRGRITFAEPSYSPQTGTFMIRASVDNPEGTLRPNQYVRTRLLGAVRPNAILVPQRGVTRNPAGNAMVMVVGAEEKVEPRVIKVARTVGDSWLVSDGLKAGDRVILEGIQKARPGTQVKVVPFGAAPTGAQPAPQTAAGPGAAPPAATAAQPAKR